MKKLPLSLGLILLGDTGLWAQTSPSIDPELLSKPWNAHWITHPDITGQEIGVYLFRKTFDLTDTPGTFPIHVSADNRYKLYVNGELVCNGPSCGDLLRGCLKNI